MPAGPDRIDEILRALGPVVLVDLMRRYGRFDAAEDAVQEALLAAAVQWPAAGLPDDPRAWLGTVARRRFVDDVRSERARRDREIGRAVAGNGQGPVPSSDDSLALLFLCCHPALTPASQVVLTLRAVGGLRTAEIAAAFLLPEATVAQRISRAKQLIRKAGAQFRMPGAADRSARLGAVMHVLYLIFNEGYTASNGPQLHRAELSAEAIRLTRQLHALLPDDGEVAGLLALMLLTDAHRPARTASDGTLIPLADQDRTRWHRPFLDEGVALVTDALTRSPPGPYQVQAAIAAVHAEATTAERTDWRQIVGLYRILGRLAPSPVVTLNAAAAVAMVDGAAAGLAMLAPLDADPRMAGSHRLAAVRAHLLEHAGRPSEARAAYRLAARRTTSVPERRYLEARAARLIDR